MNRILLTLTIGAAGLMGCGRGDDLPELGTVSGALTLDGAPLADTVVHFTPTGEGRPSTAQTDGQGEYTLMYLADVEGAIVGEHTVTIEAIVTDEMDDYDEEDPSAGGAPAPTFPASATDGSIKKEVTAGNNEINIDLLSGGE